MTEDLQTLRAHNQHLLERLADRAANEHMGRACDFADLLAQARIEINRLAQENTRLRAELDRWTSGQRRKGMLIVESVPDGLEYAARLVRAQGTEGGQEHDDLLRDAGMRLKAISDAASALLAEQVAGRAIIEKAKAWRAAHPEQWSDVDALARAHNALIDAVDALGEGR